VERKFLPLPNFVLIAVPSVDIYFVNEKTPEFYPGVGKQCRVSTESLVVRHTDLVPLALQFEPLLKPREP
jgi:hypothetical protein